MLEDLSDPSHLAALGPADPSVTCDALGPKLRRRDFLKVSFANVRSLVEAREELNRLARQNAAADAREKERRRFGEGSVGLNQGHRQAGEAIAASGFGCNGEGGLQTSAEGRPEDSAADLLRLVEALFEADVLYIARQEFSPQLNEAFRTRWPPSSEGWHRFFFSGVASTSTFAAAAGTASPAREKARRRKCRWARVSVCAYTRRCGFVWVLEWRGEKMKSDLCAAPRAA